MNEIAQKYIDDLQLQPHPEGGFYRETYRASERIQEECLPFRFSGERVMSTAIYFLLPGTVFSAFHRIKSDELWHFYAGCSLNIYCIFPDGTFEMLTLGTKIEFGESFQVLVKAGCWFAAQPTDAGQFSLLGCTVSPGFDFDDFELADRAGLESEFPMHRELIARFCR